MTGHQPSPDSVGARRQADRAGHEPSRSTASRPDGDHPSRDECADCRDGLFPMYGVAPHECFWRKGPEFTLGESTLVPFSERECFVPDLNPDEGWADFKYPSACGVYYCPNCHAEEYRTKWEALVSRIGEPPAETATCAHGEVA